MASDSASGVRVMVCRRRYRLLYARDGIGYSRSRGGVGLLHDQFSAFPEKIADGSAALLGNCTQRANKLPVQAHRHHLSHATRLATLTRPRNYLSRVGLRFLPPSNFVVAPLLTHLRLLPRCPEPFHCSPVALSHSLTSLGLESHPVTGRSQSPRFQDVSKSKVHMKFPFAFEPTMANSAASTIISMLTQSLFKTSSTTRSSTPCSAQWAWLPVGSPSGSQSIASKSSRLSGLLFFVIAAGDVEWQLDRRRLNGAHTVTLQFAPVNRQDEAVFTSPFQNQPL